MNDNSRGMLFYRILAGAALLAYSPVALLRSLTGRRRLGNLRGRLGRLAYPDLAGGIWVHAVSVGEVGVAATLLSALARKAPDRRLGLSVTTEAGRSLASRILPSEVALFAFPFDLARPVERALDEVRPGLILLTETELWPLFLDRAAARGIPVALVNGRISQRSYPRYRMLRRWFAPTLERMSLFVMQSEEDARRIESLGVPRSKIRMTGNVKYDLPPAPPFRDGERLAEAAAGRPIVVAASTAEGEEDAVLEAWKRLTPRPLLAIAPRRPERFDEVAKKVEAAGLRLVRSTGLDRGRCDVYLLDTIGELAALYLHAKVAFVGGSLVPRGGHNPIEAWSAGVPVIVGPHVENFHEITTKGESLGIVARVADAEALARAFSARLADPAATAASGALARKFVAGNRGSADATADEVLALLPRVPAQHGAAG
ncbi:MAG TPA: 3-deoxy-D-manno-octulosonic acid transferase [Thermoanaerobaculia bacterium]